MLVRVHAGSGLAQLSLGISESRVHPRYPQYIDIRGNGLVRSSLSNRQDPAQPSNIASRGLQSRCKESRIVDGAAASVTMGPSPRQRSQPCDLLPKELEL